MKGILCYVTRKLEGIFDGILMEFRMRISEDKNQTQKSMYIPRYGILLRFPFPSTTSRSNCCRASCIKQSVYNYRTANC